MQRSGGFIFAHKALRLAARPRRRENRPALRTVLCSIKTTFDNEMTTSYPHGR
nr:MAG TPA: hypothetical protein [Caudoviricetes sp.]